MLSSNYSGPTSETEVDLNSISLIMPLWPGLPNYTAPEGTIHSELWSVWIANPGTNIQAEGPLEFCYMMVLPWVFKQLLTRSSI